MPRTELTRTYEPNAVEARWYPWWEEQGCFHIQPDSGKPAFTINMPPPNITGQLHMGHGLQDTVQDTYIRYKRMKGFDAHWQAGKDHAGIATQNVVEKMLRDEGLTRHDLGREAFLERAWEWRNKYGDIITEQKRKLGDSADWRQEIFTMDPGPSRAVREVFVHLYEKGLVYQGDYIINWCPRCHSAISNEEVNYEDRAGHLWHIAYPVLDENNTPTGEQITVATTRPETMLGDTAIAIHPESERTAHLKGKRVQLPLVGRVIPVIEDDFVDREFGTGCVKITPAHDPNDFEAGVRHDLERILVIDGTGKMSENAPAKYQGMDRYECRKAVLADLEAQGLLVKIEDHQHSVGQCSRCDTVIEPWLSKQWFVKVKPLVGPALEAVADGRITFHPAHWANVYNRWLENLRDWCISRQLWWGHRIPVFYCEDCGEMMVTREDPTACSKCGSAKIRQDEDVLDTWFSSWLWPFTTLGWPDVDKDSFKRYFPTDLMVTGYDIIFLWVSRMVMASLEFTGEVPFRDVFITGIVKDEKGRKMSKSLGNGIDPLDMVEVFGADAVRYSMTILNTEGQDIKLSEQKFELGRNFANKVWQAFRFLHMQDWSVLGSDFDVSQARASELADEWILSRLHSTIKTVDQHFDRYRPNESLQAIHEFIWSEFCDWYVELIKPRLYDKENESRRRDALANALHVFTRAMQLLHPFMPFLTEEIWCHIREGLGELGARQPWGDAIMMHDYPVLETALVSEEVEARFRLVQEVTVALRNIRAEQQVSPKQPIKVVLQGPADKLAVLDPVRHYVSQLVLAESFELDGERPRPAAANVVDGIDVLVALAGLIDLDAERARLEKEQKRLSGFITGLEKKLSNENFVARAPEDVVAKEREKLSSAQQDLERIQHNLNELS